MRLWSIHPKYLDTKGLLALWRESLLAKKVLEGNTKGYRNHPQLKRFKEMDDPRAFINKFLEHIYEESKARGYNFDNSKIGKIKTNEKLWVTDKQLEYELNHLKNKLKERDKEKHREVNKIKTIKEIETNALFKVRKGKIEDWEII